MKTEPTSRRSSPGRAPATFSWADLVTGRVDEAKSFYSELFRWEYTEYPEEGGVVHVHASLDGRAVAGLIGMPEQPGAPEIQPFWLNYVVVDDAAAVDARVQELGGSVRARMDVAHWGRRALVTDPTGAELAIWEPREWAGAERLNDPGCMTWNELSASDPDAAIDFYAALFGWRFEPIDTGRGLAYWSIRHSRSAAEEIGRIREFSSMEAEHELTSSWIPYFQVASAEAVVERAQGAGGLAVPPMKVPFGGWQAILYDPGMAPFGIFEPESGDD